MTIISAIVKLAEAVDVNQKWRILHETEKQLQREMARIFKKQRDIYLDVLREYRHRIDALTESVFFRLRETDSDDINRAAMDAVGRATEEAMEEVVKRGIRIALDEGGKRVIAEFSPQRSFYVDSERPRNYINRRGAELVTRVDDTTRKTMRRILEKGMEERKSYQAIARDIRNRFDEFSAPRGQGHVRDRAELVAITELGQAFEEGADIASQDIQAWGIQLEKAWLTSEDDRVSDECWENQDAGWIPFDDPFPSGDMSPLRFPGCRCTKLRRRKR